MANYTANRPGHVNQAGDALAIFHRRFMGEILMAYENKLKFMDAVLIKDIDSGKSGSFPAMGEAIARYHNPGEQLTGVNDINHAEVIIPVDRKLTAHAVIADIDEAMSHYQVRGRYAQKLGYALANSTEKHILIEAVLGARAGATVTGLPGGTQLVDANLASATDTVRAQAYVDALYAAAEQLDDNNAPEERWCAMPNDAYYTLVQTVQANGFSAIHRDYGGNASFANGDVINIAGIRLRKTNNLTQTDQSSPSANSEYFHHPINGSNTVGVVATDDAVGMVRLMGLNLESDRVIDRQAWFMVASQAVGVGFLRPESLVELASA